MDLKGKSEPSPKAIKVESKEGNYCDITDPYERVTNCIDIRIRLYSTTSVR